MSILEYLDALYFGLLRVDNTQGTFVATLQDITDNGSSGFVDVVGPDYTKKLKL